MYQKEFYISAIYGNMLKLYTFDIKSRKFKSLTNFILIKFKIKIKTFYEEETTMWI